MTLSPLQVATPELMQFGLNYGFAGGIALLFWRYITKVQKEQTETMQELATNVERMNEQQRTMNELFRGGPKKKTRSSQGD